MTENGGEMGWVQEATRRYRSAEGDLKGARRELYAAIRAALAAGLPIGKVADASPYDRQHVRRIRDNEV